MLAVISMRKESNSPLFHSLNTCRGERRGGGGGRKRGKREMRKEERDRGKHRRDVRTSRDVPRLQPGDSNIYIPLTFHPCSFLGHPSLAGRPHRSAAVMKLDHCVFIPFHSWSHSHTCMSPYSIPLCTILT